MMYGLCRLFVVVRLSDFMVVLGKNAALRSAVNVYSQKFTSFNSVYAIIYV